MNRYYSALWPLLIALFITHQSSAEGTNELQRLKEELRGARAELENVINTQKRLIDQLQARIEALENRAGTPAAGSAKPAADPGKLVAGSGNERASDTDALNTGGDSTNRVPTSLLQTGRAYLNLSLSGLFAAGASTAEDISITQPGAHDPNQNGFTVQNVEMTLTGAVDPYFRGQSSLIFQIDREGESKFELEEAFLETTSLPGNLQVKAGQYFTEFGRLNTMHPHAWAFVDTPLVNARFLGPDGLRNPGARVSWLAPLPFYSEFFAGLQDGHGETAHSFGSTHEEELFFGRAHTARRANALDDLIFSTRYAASLDLTPSQTILFGGSFATGGNASGEDANTQIYGLDLFWKWKPAKAHAGFPFVSWQTEGMYRRYEAVAWLSEPGEGGAVIDLPSEVFQDYGFYSQISYGFTRRWVAALRGEYLWEETSPHFADPQRGDRWRLSPNLTWFPSEFSKIRLQYNFDRRENAGSDHSIWLQFEFNLGAHSAHQF